MAIVICIALGIICAILYYTVTPSPFLSFVTYCVSTAIFTGILFMKAFKNENDLPFTDLPEDIPTEEDLNVFEEAA